MPVLSLDDAGDPRIADYRGIPDPELARSRGVFVAEGRLVVQRLLSSRFTTRSLMVTPRTLEALAPELDGRTGLPVFVVPQAVMNTVAGFNIHRGCLALGERPAPVRWDELARSCRSWDRPSLDRPLVVLERVGNADNVGATFRAAAAFGACGVLLDQSCADPLYRKAIRTSMGAALQVPFATDVALLDALAGLRHDGWAVVGMTPSAGASPAREVFAAVRGTRVAIVLGHEGDGLTVPASQACTRLARIPMPSAVDSLNVAMAAGIALYECRQSTVSR